MMLELMGPFGLSITEFGTHEFQRMRVEVCVEFSLTPPVNKGSHHLIRGALVLPLDSHATLHHPCIHIAHVLANIAAT